MEDKKKAQDPHKQKFNDLRKKAAEIEKKLKTLKKPKK